MMTRRRDAGRFRQRIASVKERVRRTTQDVRFLFTALMAACVLLAAGELGAAPNSFLLVWAGDKVLDDGVRNSDFLAVIDADKKSHTYGKVLTTVPIESSPGKHLLDELGLVPGVTSDVLNEAHHVNEEPLITPGGNKFLFLGGLISTNIFRCEVTDPLNMDPCPLVVDSRKVKNFSAVDDMHALPNGHMIATYMGAKNLTTPGGLVEFTADGSIVAEYAAAKPGGPVRYRPNIDGQTDTGLLAHPHGLSVRQDLDILISSDYADPLSLATSSPTDQHQNLGTTVRVWKLSNLAAGPQKIIQMPDGPRVEDNRLHEEPEGLMSILLTRAPQHRGAFVASMCGGAVFYTPDITVANPVFREVYDFGPCTGASVFTLTADDEFLIMPIAGIQSPGDPVYNRDRSGEHDRRVVVLDIRRLISAGHDIQCAAPPVINDGPGGTTTRLLAPNNGAEDCPVEAGSVTVNSRKNFETHGGPHLVTLDDQEKRVAFSNYFADLRPFGLTGTGSVGDDKLCIANLGKKGELHLDREFRDELTGDVCLDFDRATSYQWPNRGATGNAKPHGMIFVDVGKTPKPKKQQKKKKAEEEE
jgi:56kDa selenium binding protein (SBP56)